MRRSVIAVLFSIAAPWCALCLCQSKGAEIHALLIGVTEYASLPAKQDLVGPANDVELMRTTLMMERFGVAESNIVVLAESQPASHRPTYQNIARCYEELISRVAPGDQVVILHSGHGSQNIDNDPENPDDREPDGLDEIFLPSDMKGWNEQTHTVDGAIRDDQIGEWLQQIRDRGASVFFVSDSCHSDTQTRGSIDDSYRSRGVELIPKELLPRSNSRGVGGASPSKGGSEIARGAGIVAIFAAQSNEETPDGFRDPKTKERQDVGLLTYTICGILRTTPRAITFRELGQRVQLEYNNYRRESIGASIPTPAIEGTDLDREVLGTAFREGRSRIRFSRKREKLFLTASKLDGLMPGSVLKLFPAAGEANDDQAIGWAVVESSDLRQCIAYAANYDPQTGDSNPIDNADSLPELGRCEIESRSFGPLRIHVGLDESAEIDAIQTAMQGLQDAKNSFVVIDESPNPRFRLRVSSDYNSANAAPEVILERRERTAEVPTLSRFLLGPVDEHLRERLESAFKHILRVESLADIAGDMQAKSTGSSRSSEAINVEVTMERNNRAESEEWSAVSDPTSSSTLKVGDVVRFRLVNRGRSAVRVTALYMGDDYRIVPIFPSSEFDNNTLEASADEAKSTYLSSAIPVESTARCIEHLVVLATRESAGDDTKNFNFLAQQPLRSAWTAEPAESVSLLRAVASKSRGRESMSPLQSAMDSTLFEPGGTRGGLGAPSIPEHSMAIISWDTAESVVPSTSTLAKSILRERFGQVDTRPWQPQVSQSKSRGIGSQVYPQVAPAVVVVRTQKGYGTGFFISQDGWLLTNHHVVDGCEVDPKTGFHVVSIHIGTLRGDWMELSDTPILADVYKWSEESDLALLKLRELPQNMKSVPYLKLADKSAAPGSDCVAIGHPASGVLWTLRSGEIAGAAEWPSQMIDELMAEMSAVASKRDELRRQLAAVPARQIVLSTCGLNPGDSGGPLVNAAGELIAVSFAIPKLDMDEGVNLDKFSYHVDLSEVKKFIADRPKSPMIQQPSDWPEYNEINVADANSNGRTDTLVFLANGDSSPVGFSFDLDEDSSMDDLKNASGASEVASAWDGELVIQRTAGLRVMYDTNNDGQFDLLLDDSNQDGLADAKMVFSSGTWNRSPLGEPNRPLLDISYFDTSLRKRLQANFQDAITILDVVQASAKSGDGKKNNGKNPKAKGDKSPPGLNKTERK